MLPCTKRIISEIPLAFNYSLHFDHTFRKFLLDFLVDSLRMGADPQQTFYREVFPDQGFSLVPLLLSRIIRIVLKISPV
jgi:hypothetical protein